MAKVLQQKNQVFLWKDDFLFFEWKIELSDAIYTSCNDPIFISSYFKLDGEQDSFLHFDWIENKPLSIFQLITVSGHPSRNARIIISDNKNSVIHDVDTSTDDLKHIDLNSWTVFFDTPSRKKFPLTITGTGSNSNIIPHYRRSKSIEKHTTFDESYPTDSTAGSTELLIDFKKMLDNPIYSDIALKVEDVSIKAHKNVLHARSPVFQKMLTHDTMESAENIITISDVSASVMKKFISYLYTGEKEECCFDESCELYYAADKYEVLSLRKACREELLTHLQVDNACILLGLANRHSDEGFVKEVVQFINANFKSVVETKSFDDLTREEMKQLMMSQARTITK